MQHPLVPNLSVAPLHRELIRRNCKSVAVSADGLLRHAACFAMADPSRAGDEQGLHVCAARHLRVRRVKALAQFSLRYKRAGKKEGFFQGLRLAKSDVEKRIAEIGPLGLVLASKRCMVGIRCGDDKCISICKARNEDPRIAGRK